MDPLKVQPQAEAKLHFLDYWRIIRIRKTVIIAVFLLVSITATIVTFILPESFASTTRIRIERDSSDVQGMSEGGYMRGYDPYFIQTEFEVIQSDVILGRVISALNLKEDWGKKLRGPGEKLKQQEAEQLLKDRMSLRPVRNTSLIEITLYSEDKEEAARLAQAVAEAYCGHRIEQIQDKMLEGIKTLDQRLKQQADQVQAMQSELETKRKELKISDPDPASLQPTPTFASDTIRRLQAMSVDQENIYVGKLKTLEELRPMDKMTLRQVLPRTVRDQLLTESVAQLNLAEKELISLSKNYAQEHPEYITAKKLVDQLNKQIDEQVVGIMKNLETEVAAEKAKADHFVRTVEDARKKDREEAERSQPYYDIKRQMEDVIDFQKVLGRKASSLKVDADLSKKGVAEIVDPARVEDKAVRPKKGLNIALGVIIGLIVGVGLAFFIEYLDTSVKTIDDVERMLQAPVLGVIPQNVGYLIDESGDSPHAEAYRVLRTNLLFSRKDDKLNSMAVVSAGAGEGKSTTVFNLATVFAQNGQRVVVVDSDLRRPTLHKIVGVANSIGLTNYLLKQNTLDEVIQTTKLPTLDFMASGKLPGSSLGILSSTQMRELITELKRRYDFVFFDSPPIMGVSDASILASEVDMTMQVIQYRRYPLPMNIRAKQLIEKVGGNLLGIVLNNINMSQDESYYYYSGYYHDYYSKNEEMNEASGAKAAKDKPKA